MVCSIFYQKIKSFTCSCPTVTLWTLLSESTLIFVTGQSSKIEAPFNFAPFAKALVKPKRKGFSIQMDICRACHCHNIENHSKINRQVFWFSRMANFINAIAAARHRQYHNNMDCWFCGLCKHPSNFQCGIFWYKKCNELTLKLRWKAKVRQTFLFWSKNCHCTM